MNELKSCPFCGKDVADVALVGEHEYADQDEGAPDYSFFWTHYDVVCDYSKGGCGASTGKQYKTPEEAAEAWNRRA